MAARSTPRLSSTYTKGHDAAKAIDGRMETFAATKFSAGAWLSVRVPNDSPIGWVAVHNRRDEYSNLLGEIGVWLGVRLGDTSAATAHSCGVATFDASQEPAPYLFFCGGVSRKPMVTVKQLGTGKGYLSVAELEPFIIT